MSIRLKCALLAGLAAAALCMGIWAFGSITAPEDEVPDYYYEGASMPQDTKFVLRDYDGYIGIYSSLYASATDTVTDIKISTLRDTDRKMLSRGIPVSGRGELLTLLEDFGS